ncbi:OmpP1/FadL family transporter [candidate division KSB1 bacterium]
MTSELTTQRIPVRAFLLFLSLWICCLPPHIRADSFDTFGLGSRNKGLGGTGVALSGAGSAVYYNPAALAGLTDTELGLEYSQSFLDLTLERNGPNKWWIDYINFEPDGSYQDMIEATRPSLEAARNIPDMRGLNLVLAGPLLWRITFGLAAHIPGRTLVKQKFGPSETPYFLDYSVPSRRFSFLLGLAAEIAPYLSVGLGTSILASTEGEAVAHVPLDDANREVLFYTDYDFRTKAAPTAGLLFSAGEKLDLGFSYRGELSMGIDTQQLMITNVDVGPFRLDMPLPVRLRATTQFSPRRVSLGVAWRPSERIVLTGEVTQVAWSAYSPPFPDIEIDYSEIDKIALPLKHPVVPEVPDVGFKDIVVPRVGVEAGIGHGVTFRAGSFYHPSPAPAQRGPTNIIAPDLLGLTFGIGADLNPGWIFPRPLEINFHLQGIDLIGGTIEKDESLFKDESSNSDGVQNSNPGFPGIEYDGWIFSFGVGIVLPL